MESQENRSNQAQGGGRSGLQFVVLRHEGSLGGSHWDFMMEIIPQASVLMTWRLPAWEPLAWRASPVRLSALRLADHRRDYLTYQGDLSGNRGRVVRVASGDLLLWEWAPASFHAQLHSDGHTLDLQAAAQDDGHWILTFRAALPPHHSTRRGENTVDP